MLNIPFQTKFLKHFSGKILSPMFGTLKTERIGETF